MKAVVLTNVNQQFFKNSSINANSLLFLLLQLKVLPKYWAHNVEQVSGWVGCSESRLWLNPLLQACTLVRTLSGIVIAKWGAGLALVLKMSNISSSSSSYFEKGDHWVYSVFSHRRHGVTKADIGESRDSAQPGARWCQVMMTSDCLWVVMPSGDACTLQNMFWHHSSICILYSIFLT